MFPAEPEPYINLLNVVFRRLSPPAMDQDCDHHFKLKLQQSRPVAGSTSDVISPVFHTLIHSFPAFLSFPCILVLSISLQGRRAMLISPAATSALGRVGREQGEHV